MSRSLPPYAARANEPIPAPSARPDPAPDMRAAVPIETMLARLAHVADDEVVFVDQFRSFISSIGCTLMVHYDVNGGLFINLGCPADPQIRHRNRWAHFLFDRLDAVDGRRETLERVLIAERRVWDERPVRPGETTVAIRGFLRAGGRILISPTGRLEENGCAKALSLTDASADEHAAAAHRYFDVRRRQRGARQIRRAVKMLGSNTSNGWIVLEARA